jgi:hypothetical protein
MSHIVIFYLLQQLRSNPKFADSTFVLSLFKKVGFICEFLFLTDRKPLPYLNDKGRRVTFPCLRLAWRWPGNPLYSRALRFHRSPKKTATLDVAEGEHKLLL